MGDFRAIIKCQVSMLGVERKCDMSINWSPNQDGIDDRVVEFFRNWAETAKQQYAEDLYEYQRGQREKEERDKELRELARLKAKYESTAPDQPT